ncbi:MAG: hypothetical protein U0X93_13875 [Anaerolineales bacterium]
MEWCENRILAKQGMNDLTGFIERFEHQLKRVFPGLQDVERLLNYLEKKKNCAKARCLSSKAMKPRKCIFIESGLVTINFGNSPNGKRMRLRSIRGGATVGEIGLYLRGLARVGDRLAQQRGVSPRRSSR